MVTQCADRAPHALVARNTNSSEADLPSPVSVVNRRDFHQKCLCRTSSWNLYFVFRHWVLCGYEECREASISVVVMTGFLVREAKLLVTTELHYLLMLMLPGPQKCTRPPCYLFMVYLTTLYVIVLLGRKIWSWILRGPNPLMTMLTEASSKLPDLALSVSQTQ
jgi:hypothetical protein